MLMLTQVVLLLNIIAEVVCQTCILDTKKMPHLSTHPNSGNLSKTHNSRYYTL